MNENTDTTKVWITRGTKYHTDPACPLMRGGENLWDSDHEENWHIAGSFRREVPNVRAASHGLGRLPCLGCVPAELRMLPLLWGETFDHRAIDLYESDNIHGVHRLVCERCVVWNKLADGLYMGVPVSWPCSTYTVLNRASPPHSAE